MNIKERNLYQMNWRKNNPEKIKLIRSKSESRPERKEYIKNWQKSPRGIAIRKRYAKSEKYRAYNIKWNREHPEKVRTKYKKYYNSIKGIINYLKKKDKKKFNIINKDINEELIKMVNDRDKNCVYCQKQLLNIKNEYDHLNPFKPFSKLNMVKSCVRCNRSKGNANVVEWCKFMNYKPSKIVLDLVDIYKYRFYNSFVQR